MTKRNPRKLQYLTQSKRILINIRKSKKKRKNPRSIEMVQAQALANCKKKLKKLLLL